MSGREVDRCPVVLTKKALETGEELLQMVGNPIPDSHVVRRLTLLYERVHCIRGKT